LLSETHINLKAKKHNNIIKDIFSNYYSVAKNRKYLMYTTSLIFISSAEFALSNYIGVHLHDEFKSIFIGDFEINGIRMMNIMTIINTIMVVTSTFIIGNLFKKFNEQFILILGVLIYIISYGVSHYSLNIYILILCIIIATFGELMFAPVYSVLQARFMPEDQKGSYLAFSSIGNSGANMLASSGLIMGTLLGSFNMMILVIFYGIIGIILLFLSTKNLH